MIGILIFIYTIHEGVHNWIDKQYVAVILLHNPTHHYQAL